ncbi:hypothetical protein Y032_0023g830 [Ancylostoma ceylanicum]|uniref:Uncharacterized protein n=1 Tax=Ancylostoma ceylanicum TaxID=53326 RepID=A0A016UYG2_9BILA|nr:hypothetical protein Y032_0023g830 [Ancylostoma ceylanicum]
MKFVLLLLVVCGCAARSGRFKRHQHPPLRPYFDVHDDFYGGASSGGFDSPFGDYDARLPPSQVKDHWREEPLPLPHPPTYEHPQNHYQVGHHWNNPHLKHVPNKVAMPHPQMPKVPLSPHIATTKQPAGQPLHHGMVIHQKRQ